MATERKAAIVTGAASGLGRAMALGLIESGMDVVAVDRNATALAALAPAAGGNGGSVLPVPADLTQPDAFDRIVATTLEKFGRIDVLINNAGIGQASVRADPRRNPIRFWEVTPDQWSRFLAVNATAAIMMARAVVPHMLRARQGRIITVTTSLGTMVRAGYLLYGSSKAAAESATAIMAADLAGTGVTANVLVPGGVTNTPLVGDHAGERSKMLQPEIMVPPLLWLVSDAAAGVTAKRFIAADWDRSLPAAQAAEKVGAPIAWLGIARMPIEPT
ncbi:MAG: SDR family oxidoreductase [Candidatus Rokubacteria bacterium]|nr:SDR family oxidoreductase [Candidatus Rokubacteria bacterium]